MCWGIWPGESPTCRCWSRGPTAATSFIPACPCVTCGPACWPSGWPKRFRLPRLAPDQTATMTSATLGRPVPAQLAAAIHERTDGAFRCHRVEEFLAAIDEDTLTPHSGAAVQAATVPDTLSDAVLSRARHLTTPTRDVASGCRRHRAFLRLRPADRGSPIPSPDDVASACANCRRHTSSSLAPTRSRSISGTRSSATPCTPTPACRCGGACTKGWPGPLSNAATAAGSSRRTSSRRGVPGRPLRVRGRRRARGQCPLGPRRGTRAVPPGGAQPACPASGAGRSCAVAPLRSAMRPQPPTTTAPQPRPTQRPMS